MSTNTNKPYIISLELIRLVHTIIWVLMAIAVFYVLYSGITGNINIFSWIGVSLILIEGAALLIGKGDCPLHIYALRLTEQKNLNDTFLPQWVIFRGYKTILTVIFLIGLTLMVAK